MDDSTSDSPEKGQISRHDALRRAGCWLIAGAIGGMVVTLAILRWRLADPTPPLTEEAFRQARQQWRERGPADYNVEVHVQGPQPGTYRVEVRGAVAVAAFRNGRELKQQRTLGTWGVPGMFATMARDVEQVERRRQGQVNGNTPDLTLRAGFDPEFGYPRRYVRMEAGSTQDVTWEVVRFERLKPLHASPPSTK